MGELIMAAGLDHANNHREDLEKQFNTLHRKNIPSAAKASTIKESDQYMTANDFDEFESIAARELGLENMNSVPLSGGRNGSPAVLE